MESPKTIEVCISQAEAGERIDRVLAARGLGVSRAVLQRWIHEGRATASGRQLRPKDVLPQGATVIVRPAPPPPSELVPEPLELSILHEDTDVLVVDKPAGLVVHPGAGHPSGTLANAVAYRAGQQRLAGLRPGVVHRLDKDTSGVMVVAKTMSAKEHLVAQFQAHQIERAYLAICIGRPPERMTFDTLHGRDPRHRRRFSSKVERGRRAVTHLEVIERLLGGSYVRCRLETGRTHQVRVHLADRGYPLLGDPLYGAKVRDPRVRKVGEHLGRQALHAAVLAFNHPATGMTLRFEAAPPEDFVRALEALRSPGERSSPG